MATNTKKTSASKSTKSTKAEVKKEPVKEVVVDTEKEELKKQLAEMKAQMELMSQMITQSKAEPTASTKKDRNIRFVNLTNGTAILKGSKIWTIEGRFTDRYFLEREARIIVNNMSNMIGAGLVYIADAQFVKDNDLSEIYLNILSDEDLKTLLKKDASYVVETFKTVSDGQKKIIIDMIRDEKAAGHNIDANILVKLGELSGQDLLSEE